ncbi:Ubiquitin carboxyl-terminal hydrolase 8 [Nymphaea thermarum]|nr:Ubiquitin carboxyl-terminal hydrolase 8 [Nymphaea thermarum]
MRRSLSIAERNPMEMDASSSPDTSSDSSQRPVLEGERVFFVPYRWWKEGQDALAAEEDGGGSTSAIVYASSPCNAGPMKIITNMFVSDLVFNLKQRGDLSGRLEGNDCEVSGRDYALLTEDMWLQTLNRNDFSKSAHNSGNLVEDSKLEVYPLRLRLSVMRDSNQLTARITKKDNIPEFYKRACKIFSVESEPVQIWDLSGQTASFFMNDKIKVPKDFQRQADQEMLLELQVYKVTDSVKSKSEGRKEDVMVQQSRLASSSNGSLLTNGSTCNTEVDSSSANSFISVMGGSYGKSASLGLLGLQNLGNTCFMNSAVQCLAHTPKLVEYFLGDYSREINQHNPLGMDGELAVAFGELLRKLWAPGRTPVTPQLFKSKLARFAPQFSGFNQHDSQELLAFLLDGLHEDLNRVKHKPYIESKDTPGRPDEEVADEYWANHLARNDSIIVDVCQGQYRSTLVCPVCSKVSVTFDPFMYLSLPLPSTTTRTMTVTLLSTDGLSLPIPYTVNVPKYGKCSDLIQAMGTACALRDDEKLVMAEIYSHRIIRYLEEPSDSLSLIRDDDRLVGYRISRDSVNLPIVVFMHQRLDRHCLTGQITSNWKAFGLPLITCLPNTCNGSDIHHLFQKLMVPFLKPAEEKVHGLDDDGNDRCQKGSEASETSSLDTEGNDSNEKPEFCPQFRFLLSDEKGVTKDVTINVDSALPVTDTCRRLHVLACWPDALIEQYDINHLSNLPEVYKSVLFVKRPPESVTLYACLEAFLKEEPLGPEDMYCPSCKMHRQASKKLDLWRLPEVLVIHLKRFSYSRFVKNKLESFIDFPIHDLDLSRYIARKTGQFYYYKLYAVSNHYGSMGGGHYTAYVHHLGENRWYDFDDSHVSPISEDKIKTSAAYSG